MFNTAKIKVRKQFNANYFELLDFMRSLIISIEKEKLFKTFYNKNLMLKKANPCFFIQKWYISISIPYHKEILSDNIDFFLKKENYLENITQDEVVSSSDINKFKIEKYLQSCILDFDKLDENKKIYLINSIKNLTMLSILYYKK